MRTSKSEAIVVLCVAVLAEFSFFDLTILMSVVNPSSVYGNLFQIIGEVPNYLLALLSGAVLLLYHEGQPPVVKS